MDATRFELTMSVSQDPRLAATVRELVVCAAQYAGCTRAAASAFGTDVEEAVLNSQKDPAAAAMLPIVVRRDAGPVEVHLNGHTMTLAV